MYSSSNSISGLAANLHISSQLYLFILPFGICTLYPISNPYSSNIGFFNFSFILLFSFMSLSCLPLLLIFGNVPSLACIFPLLSILALNNFNPCFLIKSSTTSVLDNVLISPLGNATLYPICLPPS